jgi:hypothetical protein
MRYGFATGLMLLLLMLVGGCGKGEKASDDKGGAGAAKPPPLFVPVEPAKVESAGEVKAERPSFRLPGAQEAASPAQSSGRFYLNAPDDPGPANEAYAANAPPAGSLAQRLSQDEPKALRWRPRWQYQGVGGVSLAAAALSSDGSVLGLVETASAPGQPDASVLVLFDTHRWSLLRTYEFPGRRLSRLTFVPGRARALVVAERQTEHEQPQEILLLGLRRGNVLSTGRQVRAPIVDLVAVEGNAMFALTVPVPGHPGGLWRLDSGNPEAAPVARQTEIVGACMAVSARCNRVAVAGPDGIVLAGFSDLHRRETVPTPGIASPRALVFTADEESLAVLGVGQPLLLIADGKARQLADRAGAALVFNPDANRLLAVLEKGHALSLHQLPDGESLGGCEPTKIKPRTNGTPRALFWLKHLGKYAVVDSQGSLCLYHQPGRKWRKELLLDAKR